MLENGTGCGCPPGMVQAGDNCTCPVGFMLEAAEGCKGEKRQNQQQRLGALNEVLYSEYIQTFFAKIQDV